MTQCKFDPPPRVKTSETIDALQVASRQLHYTGFTRAASLLLEITYSLSRDVDIPVELLTGEELNGMLSKDVDKPVELLTREEPKDMSTDQELFLNAMEILVRTFKVDPAPSLDAIERRLEVWSQIQELKQKWVK